MPDCTVSGNLPSSVTFIPYNDCQGKYTLEHLDEVDLQTSTNAKWVQKDVK